jgi:hypothetical protein
VHGAAGHCSAITLNEGCCSLGMLWSKYSYYLVGFVIVRTKGFFPIRRMEKCNPIQE